MSAWPQAEERWLKTERRTVIIQINGRMRDRIEVESGASENAVRELVLVRPKVRQWAGERRIKKFIYVPGRIVNIVV